MSAAEDEPVLITKNGKPAVWMVSAGDPHEASGDREAYQDVLTSIAVATYSDCAITIGKAARLADQPVVDFIQLCGDLGIPIVRDPPGGLEAEYAELGRALGEG